ncbi:hypothetical protein CkaCkLH20_06635 [Colletotrichum karsti]|uniref:HNH nuclease domain-containing protein n=1 Tax=Colletotrichum karsti TaxID=1095194 RepID=A0A9P6I3E2_9PEZI|nr:uncharacterized protein CkaCkLH20_06635 [Colletotrichum karsti]KAF9875703.1 hypothetical protein CkaCkLH20_06635 [Colletotrichum karsti]
MSSPDPSMPARGATPTTDHVVNKLKRALERDDNDDTDSFRALKVRAVDAVLTAIDDPNVAVGDLRNMLRRYQLPHLDARPNKPPYDWANDFDERYKLNKATFHKLTKIPEGNAFARGRIVSAAVMLAPMWRLREICNMTANHEVDFVLDCYPLRDGLAALCDLSLAKDKPRELEWSESDNEYDDSDDEDDNYKPAYHEWYGISKEEVSAERSAIKEAFTRDKHYVITKTPGTKPCYLFNPFLRSYLRKFRRALKTVSPIWGEEKIDGYLAKLTKENLSGPSNMISVSPLARAYWKKGWIALEPIRQETPTSLRVRYHVLRTTGDVDWKIRHDIRKLLQPIRDEHGVDIALFEYGTYEHISDGFEFLITADDAGDLPDLELTRLCWEIRQMASMAGFGISEDGFY